MTRLSDEEIVNKCFVIPRMALPTEKADTVRGWKHAEVFYFPQIEKLQGEIERLKPFASAYENINEYFSGEDIVAKYESSQLELAQLTAKHERLVKWLKEEDRHFVETNEVLEKLTEEGNV